MKKTLKTVLSVMLVLATVLACIPMTAAADASGLIGEVQGNVPEMHISIDSGYSLDTIHASKEAKIRAHVSVEGSWDSAYDRASTGVEMKTRGNSSLTRSSLIPKLICSAWVRQKSGCCLPIT